MAFLAATWWVWLIVAAVLFLVVIMMQVAKMKSMISYGSDHPKLFSGIGIMMVCSFTASICFILFLIGIIVRLVSM